MRVEVLMIRKLADKSVGRRESRFDENTGERYLYNPDTPGTGPESWPLAGIRIENEGGPPAETSAAQRWVAQGVADGWIELVGAQIDHRPGGPPGNPWAKTHTFIQASQLVLKTVDGEVRYNVRRNPGVFTESGSRTVDWFYHLERA